MSKYKYEWTQDKFNRFVKEKRGQGHGKDYKPWLTTQDVPSIGRRSRVLGWKTGRLHHVFSDLETRYLYLLDWADDVIDIREQFPLINLEVAQNIASDMGVRYPTDTKSNFPYVLSTDFFITVIFNGQNKYLARTVKPAKELDKRRVIEKFEIERRYWAAKSIDWGIVTENEIPRTLAANIEHYHSDFQLEPTAEIELSQMYRIANLLKEKLRSTKQSVIEVSSTLDRDLHIEIGTCLRIFRNLVARKEIQIDLTQKFNLSRPAQSFINVVYDKEYKERKA